MTVEDYRNDELISKAILRNFISIDSDRITYNIHQKKSYRLSDPEEFVRAQTISFLILERNYNPSCIKTEVTVPRRTPEDSADIVVYRDTDCTEPYLVVENKKERISESEKRQAIEQLFGNANSLRVPLGLLDYGIGSSLYNVADFPPTERIANLLGDRDLVPVSYGEIPEYKYIAGTSNDIKPVEAGTLETKVRRSHSIIWAGGKRDPLQAFDEWSKLMLAKVEDERHTPNGSFRQFQIGTNEPAIVVANRIHLLFEKAIVSEPNIFPEGISIGLTDSKIFDVVKILQDVSLTDTSTDNIGAAFELFFGSVFRGELGQYFTMRPLARFVVSMLKVSPEEYVIDPTCGSGGFLLEVLLQVWNRIDKEFAGRRELERIKNDFALTQVYGIEIHEILARICKINLLLHHDGHTNIEGDKSCLDVNFTKPLLTRGDETFNVVVGNPPFGDNIKDKDEDQLGVNSFSNFVLADGKRQVASEHIIIEKSVNLLQCGGRLGFILPDGVFNNQGDQSNCPQVRKFLVENGKILSIVSLPDYAFRKSGAQNKTSILFYQKYTSREKKLFDQAYSKSLERFDDEGIAIEDAIKAVNYKTFMAEAQYIGYTPTGILSNLNDLYKGSEGGHLDNNQFGTILGEYERFLSNPLGYEPAKQDCYAFDFFDVWTAHDSHRLDPKYHLFKVQENQNLPDGWMCKRLSLLMQRREEQVHPENNPNEFVKVMTLSQTGDIRERAAGKGQNPPEWLGMYFEDSASKWFKAYQNDVVFSSIDLWKGCISVVGEEFDGAIVTKEYPIYQMLTDEILPEFLAALFRTRYYRRAFRAITTGHSNRRRTQTVDFEAIDVCYPQDKDVQRRLIQDISSAKQQQQAAINNLNRAMSTLSNVIDGREDDFFDEEIDEIE